MSTETEKKPSPQVSARVIKAREQPIKKADSPTALNKEDLNGSVWLTPPMELHGLSSMVDHSTILPQCIRAYKDNVAGFGISLRYREDADDETEEMKSEWTHAGQIIDLLNIDQDTKEVFEDIIEDRETYGISYLEVIRDLAGEVVQIEFVKDTPTVTKTKPLDPPMETEYFYRGQVINRKKRFCKYKQEKNGKVVYFKEFGDPRIMDIRTGVYAAEGEVIDIDHQSNELLEFAIGTEDYGKVRWIGQALNVDGSRKAENLNNNYFANGRHTPLAVVVSGGTLSEESYARLQQYLDDIKGEKGQHSFLLLEVQDTENKANFEEDKQPKVELKDLASILQKDELFQDYLNNSRRKVQSAFRLPDLYTGYTTDFNRATAQTAMEVTEKQVFQPERESLAWIINNKLLNGYAFKYVEVFFEKPDITNPDDLFKMLSVCNNAGGFTPNKAKQVAYDTMGWDGCEDYEGEWGDIPLAVAAKQAAQNTANSPEVMQQLTDQIKKAARTGEGDEVVSVMKQVRDLLKSMRGEQK